MTRDVGYNLGMETEGTGTLLRQQYGKGLVNESMASGVYIRMVVRQRLGHSGSSFEISCLQRSE